GSWPRAYAAQRGTLTGPANAHSLYLETFAELGIVGLALLVAALALSVRGPPAAIAVVAAYGAAAAIDWDWQLPAVTIPALVAAVVGNGSPTRSQARLAARLLPYDARPWTALYTATGERADLRRACRADAGDLTLKREAYPIGGCSPSRR